MTKPFLKMLHVSLPGNGKSQTYTLTPESQTKFDFSLAEALFAGKNGNLEISVEGKGTVILENYQELVAEGEMPPFVLIDGEELAGDVYLFAFGVQDQTDGDLETAAGNTGGGSGAGEYSDDAGTLGDGLSSLSGQSDTYSSEHFVTLSGTIGNHLPIANDDTAAISEAGDSDFSLERSIVFVEDEAAYREILASDEEAVGEYFSLAQDGGFYISNPNPPQIDDVVEGNVIDNDVDSDGDKLIMESIRYVGDNHDGEKGLVTNDGVVDNTVVLGKYGVLVIDSDGHYEYTLNQEWADGLNEGETFDEVFQYTIVDAVGGESNVATLTVTITGANDMPVAHDDLNVQAVEVGDSESYDLHASVYDADLAGSGGTVDVHDSEEYDYTQSDNVSVSGNLLAGDDAGGVTDTDVDSGDSPDGETMFVVGVYSEYSEILDYVLPTEQNTDFVASDAQTYDVAVADSDSSVSVSGEFGVLTIQADGSYEYVLYTEEDGEAYAALNALNYDSEDNVDQFTYAIMDDSGAFSYANISFTVNGANDAPVAYADVNAVNEYGLKEIEGESYSATVEGNVILGDDSVGADTDVDDSVMYVATIESQTGESDTLYTDESMDSDAIVTIDGEYGTLTIHADGSYEYTLQNEWASVQGLNEEDHPEDVFTYTLTNAYADDVFSEPTTLTIMVNGSNDAPVAVADANAFTESVDDEPQVEVSGNLLSGDEFGNGLDTDVDNSLDEFSVTGVESNDTDNKATDGGDYDYMIEGQFGTLYLNADGDYTYVENQDATEYLNNDDDSVTDTFTYTMTDNQDGYAGYASATLTITITGANDAPVAVNDYNAFTESVNDEVPVEVSGNLLTGDALGNGLDTDVDNSLDEFSVTGITSDDTDNEAGDGGDYDYMIEGQFGTLYVNADGDYIYVENQEATEYLNTDDATVTDTFTYTMSDNQAEDAKSSEATLVITITGANDGPVAVADVNSFTESVDGEAEVQVSGNLLTGDGDGNGADTDADNEASDFSVLGVESENTSSEAVENTDEAYSDYAYTIDGQYGTLYFNSDGSYLYVEDSDATDSLNADSDAVEEVFTYTMTDNQDGTDAQSESTLTITISGADDAPVTDPSLALSGTEDTTLVITEAEILAYVSDVDTSADGLEVTSITIDGVTLSGNSTDGWTYTPEHNVNGELSISYTVSDGTTTVSGSGTLTLAEAEEPPVAIDDVYEGINITTAPEVNEITSFSTFDEKGSVTMNNITLTAVSYEPADGALEFSAGWDDSVRFESLHNNDDLGVNNDWWGISKDDSDNIDSKGQQDGVTITFTDGGKETVTIDLGSWDDDDSLLLYINGSTYTSSYTVVDSLLTITASDYDVSAITSITLLADDAYGDSYFNISAISAYSGEDVQVLDLGSDASNAAHLIDGNVLANDLDLEGDTLIVTDVDGTSVSGDDTIIYGDYGVLTIDSDGHYEYQLYEDGDSNIPDGGTVWTDLTGDVTETFHYTVAESDDTSASDVGTLEIPIHVGANVVTDTTLNAVGHHFMEGSDSDDIIYLDSSAHYVELGDGEDTVIVDDDYITDSTKDVTIYSFDDDDGLVLNDLMGETVTFGQNSDHDLTLTIVDHDGSETNDVVITLDNYNLGDLDLSGAEQALVYNHTIEISSSHESLDSLVQSIINSPDNN